MRCPLAAGQSTSRILVDGVVVVEIVRRALIEPAGLAGVDVAGEDACGPFVVAGPLIRVPRPGLEVP